MAHGTSLLPPTEYLTQTPVICGAGTSFVHECRGSSEGQGRYIYAIFNRTNFWRYDIWTDAWQQLASPPVVATAVFGAGVAMCIDSSRGIIYMTTPRSMANWHIFEVYDIATDTWAALNTVAGLAVPWATDAQLLHLCRQENTTAVVPLDLAAAGVTDVLDDHIYLIGNNAVTLYRYSIAANAWTTVVPAGPRGGAPGAGTTLNWMPDLTRPVGFLIQANSILWSLRGGGTAILDGYEIASATWFVPIAYIPQDETFSAGTCSIYDPTDVPSIVFYQNNSMNLRAFSVPVTSIVTPLLTPMSTFTGTDGVAHVGNLLTYVRFDDGTTYYYMAKHSERAFMRILRTI